VKKTKFMLPSPKDTLEKRMKIQKLLLGNSMFICAEDIFKEKTHMSDEELYYIASSLQKMETIKQQRAMFDMMHFQCDEDSVKRFMSYFSNDVIQEIMYSC